MHPTPPPEVKLQSYADNFPPFVQSREIKLDYVILSNYSNKLHYFFLLDC